MNMQSLAGSEIKIENKGIITNIYVDGVKVEHVTEILMRQKAGEIPQIYIFKKEDK